MPDRTKQVNDLVKIPRQVAVWARMVADREGRGEISRALGQALAGPPIEECRVYADACAVRAYRGAKSIRVDIDYGSVLSGHNEVAPEEVCIGAGDKRLTVGDADTLLAKSPGRNAFREFCGLPPVEGEKPYGCYDLVGFLQDVVKSWGPSPAYEIEALGHGYAEQR